MHNELFTIGPVTVYAYGLMIATGVAAAYIVTKYRAKKKNIAIDFIDTLAAWALVGGVVGAKLLYAITQYKEVMSNPMLLIDLSNGYVVYGAIIGGIAGAYIFCKKMHLDFLQYFDLIIPQVALAQGFGRIGCHLAGCCYGMETNSFIGVIFPVDSFAPGGVSLLPTQLISSAFDFALFGLLVFFSLKAKKKGQVGAVYLICYGIGRFIIEFYRGDLIRGAVGTFSTSQFISIFIVAIGIAFYIIRGKSKEMA